MPFIMLIFIGESRKDNIFNSIMPLVSPSGMSETPRLEAKGKFSEVPEGDEDIRRLKPAGF